MNQRALTWSGKWHIVNLTDPDASRYATALCGSYVYRDDDPQYPAHLKRIKDGTKKSTGLCKSCARCVGQRTATVELPPPTSDRYEGDEHESTDRLSWLLPPYEVSVWNSGEVQLGLDGVNGEPLKADDAHALAAALLAAAAAAGRTR